MTDRTKVPTEEFGFWKSEGHPLDVCRCGDWRHQHVDGTGRCRLGSLCTPHPCQKFRLFKEAGSDGLCATCVDELAGVLDPCDHDFGGWRESDDGRGGEQFCQKCGLGAMDWSMRFLP